jgi:hypothetical protein
MKTVSLVISAFLGVIFGTLLHELYHYLAALVNKGNPDILITGYGIGVKSGHYSSEIVAYGITFITIILFFVISVKKYNKERKK